MTERVVPVAYVTKWSGPIEVWKNATAIRERVLVHEKTRAKGAVSSAHWTEDRAEAEKRWRENRNEEIKAAERKLTAAAKALRDGPTWEEK